MGKQRIILIVEDDEGLRKLWRTALAFAGFEVMEAGDGIHALRVLDAYLPDLVVLDIGLPKLDGISVQQEIAAQAVTRHVPVVIVTGSTDELGHLDVPCILRKPVAIEGLIQTIRKCLPAEAPGVYA
jgi:DNA-binding response OmpR family regulator